MGPVTGAGQKWYVPVFAGDYASLSSARGSSDLT